MYQLKAQQRQTRRGLTEENATTVDELALSQQDQPQIHHSIHQIAQSGIARIIFFTAIMV